MPCHNKKLEASRPDFKFSDKRRQTENVAAVNLVITTQELIELIEEWKVEQGLLGDILVSTDLLKTPPPWLPIYSLYQRRNNAFFRNPESFSNKSPRNPP